MPRREKPTEAQLMAYIAMANNVVEKTGKKHDQAVLNLAYFVNQMKHLYPETFNRMLEEEKRIEEQIRLNNAEVDKKNAEKAFRRDDRDAAKEGT